VTASRNREEEAGLKGVGSRGGAREKGDRRRENEAGMGRGWRASSFRLVTFVLVPVVPIPACLTCAVETASVEGVIDAVVTSIARLAASA